MAKLIRPTYPAGFSIGLLVLIFIISYFLSHQIFDVPVSALKENQHVYFGMLLVAIAVIIVFLIIMEEILFPIKVREINGGIIFRNHGTKLRTQLLIYFTIPAIFWFIYVNYDVNHVRFFIWAIICIVTPIIEKIASGLKNYNDFLKMTNEKIQYQDNEKEGDFEIKNIKNIIIIRDENSIIKKLQLLLSDNNNVIIDLDEMELDAFYVHIENYITSHYKHLLKEPEAA
jgi:hypothetical protein